MSFGGGAWGQLFALGGGMDGGVAFGSNGNVCVYSNRCNSLGWNGPFGGSAGAVVQVSKGKLCSGDQESFGVYFFGGGGLGGEGQFQMSNDGPQLGRGIGPLSYGVGAGVVVDEYPETRIATRDYNQFWWRGSLSRSEFRVIDGKTIFQLPWTIVIAVRVDTELDWGFVHNSLRPFVGRIEKRLVTDKELEPILSVARDNGARHVAFPFYESSLLANANQLVQAKLAMKP